MLSDLLSVSAVASNKFLQGPCKLQYCPKIEILPNDTIPEVMISDDSTRLPGLVCALKRWDCFYSRNIVVGMVEVETSC